MSPRTDVRPAAICPAHGVVMEERSPELVSADAGWCGTWYDCFEPTCSVSILVPSDDLKAFLAAQADQQESERARLAATKTVVRHDPELGWALFDRKGNKVWPSNTNTYCRSRKAARRSFDDFVAGAATPTQEGSDQSE